MLIYLLRESPRRSARALLRTSPFVLPLRLLSLQRIMAGATSAVACSRSDYRARETFLFPGFVRPCRRLFSSWRFLLCAVPLSWMLFKVIWTGVIGVAKIGPASANVTAAANCEPVGVTVSAFVLAFIFFFRLQFFLESVFFFFFLVPWCSGPSWPAVCRVFYLPRRSWTLLLRASHPIPRSPRNLSMRRQIGTVLREVEPLFVVPRPYTIESGYTFAGTR